MNGISVNDWVGYGIAAMSFAFAALLGVIALGMFLGLCSMIIEFFAGRNE